MNDIYREIMLFDLDAVIADADEIPESEMTCNTCASWNDGSAYNAGLLGWCNHRRREACYGNETCKEWYPKQTITRPAPAL